MPEILVTNDDGIQSPALEALEIALADFGEVTIVAPDREKILVQIREELRDILTLLRRKT